MKLDTYLKLVLSHFNKAEVEFEINLTSDVRVVDYETGNKIKFKVKKKTKVINLERK